MAFVDNIYVKGTDLEEVSRRLSLLNDVLIKEGGKSSQVSQEHIESTLKYIDNATLNSKRITDGIRNYNNCLKYIEFTKTQPAQKSIEWLIRRSNCLTASDTHKVVKCQNMNGKTVTDLATNKALRKFGSFSDNIYTRWGERYEDTSVQIYEKMFGVKIYESALLEHPTDSRLGASCDGFIPLPNVPDAECIEIKNPYSREPEEGYTPDNYYQQMQTQLYVTGFNVCNFFDCKIEDWDHENEFIDDVQYFLANQDDPDFKKSPKYYGIVATFIDLNDEKNIRILEDWEIQSVLNEDNWIHNKLLDRKIPNITDIDPEYRMELKPLYIYSELLAEDISDYDTIFNELKERVFELMNKPGILFTRFKWWKLQKFVHNRVHRDPDWIVRYDHKLNQFWDKVHKIRDEHASNSEDTDDTESKLIVIEEDELTT